MAKNKRTAGVDVSEEKVVNAFEAGVVFGRRREGYTTDAPRRNLPANVVVQRVAVH